MLLTCLIGWGVCLTAGWNPHLRELGVAVAVSMLSAGAALATTWLLGGRDAGAQAQAGLAGLVVLMLATVLFAAGATMLQVVPQREPFVLWLLLLSWVSLIALAFTSVSAIRLAHSGSVSKA